VRASVATTGVVLVLFAGCVDELQGSNIQFDFSSATPVSDPGTHLEVYAFESDPMAGRLFSVQSFEIHKIANLASPCFIDVGDHVPHPGLHVSQYAVVIGADENIPDIANPPANATEAQKIAAATAVQREQNVQLLAGPGGIKAITSSSTSVYPTVAADCADADGIPPPQCTDDVSNKRRLDRCQAAWAADPNMYEGTDRILTSPLNGEAHGDVDGVNPINLSPVGGASFYPPDVLDGFTGYALYQQTNDQTTPGGTLLMYGTPTMITRGVLHVHMTNPMSPDLYADMAIFPNLGEDDDAF
jgi:hypothetical protein